MRALARTALSALVISAVPLLITSDAAWGKAHPVDVPTTYCNPMNLDYAYALKREHEPANYTCHRSTADPVCVVYKGKYFLFSTNQEGYWSSDDLLSWNFIPSKFKPNACGDQVCAPGAWPTDRGLLFLPCFVKEDTMPLYITTDAMSGKWKEAVSAFPVPAWDPSFFQDEDGKLYCYWGSSNVYPIYGVELDPDNGYKPKGRIQELLHLDQKKHGWEQFGEDNQNGKMDPFVEGAWMNKFNGKYYLQYGAPGTEFNVYGDGVYVSDKPLGPFTYQTHNPFCWKPGGFARGAGHGSTFVDKFDNVWHVATMDISVKDTFERRIGLFPSGVDKDGVLYTDTEFGDYPYFVPKEKRDPSADFTGWMLLSYKKPATSDASKTEPALAFDEDIKTYWSAPDGKPGHYLSVDLGKPKNVRALQINYADEQATLYGKVSNIRHRYQIFESMDGKKWNLLVDKSNNSTDVPHDYVELSEPLLTRYLKVVNVEVPTGCFAISDFRVFGSARGKAPSVVSEFTAVRSQADRRNIHFSWNAVPNAYAYQLKFGNSADKLYGSVLVYDKNSYDLHSLNVDSPYTFTVQAVSESGVSDPSAAVSVN